MEVTLNFTSKGLIHAIRTKLEQQKKEGKITGDISYNNIATCDFWDKLKEINDRHSKNNKVFHGKGYSCEDKGKNTDWTKTIVVYGSTTFKDEEWEELLGTMMGLKLTKQEEPKAEEPKEQPKVEEAKEKPAENKKDDSKEVKDVDLATTSVLLGELKALGVKDEASGRLTYNAVEAGYKFSIEDKKIVVKDKQKNVISLSELVNRMEVAEMKQQSTADNKAEVKEEVEEPKTEVKEVVVPQQPVDQNFDDLLKVQNTNPWNTQY